MKYHEAERYWQRAGEVSYASAMFADAVVERHINQRLWQIGIEIGKQLGLDNTSHVLDLGCGDGTLANLVLAKHFQIVDGFDLSEAAIQRAHENAAHSNMHFSACDITQLDYARLPAYDGAYLWGILHHVKDATPAILAGLRRITKRIVVLEPNGNHLLRKLLEKTASYRAAGEDSFRTKALQTLFIEAGYQPVIWRRLNLFPNFTPKWAFQLLKVMEPLIETTPLLRALCTVNMWGLIAHE